MSEPLVLLELTPPVATLILNHPQKRNALSRALLSALHAHLKTVAADESIRVVILRSAGPAFSSGHDLRELVQGNVESHRGLFSLCTQVMETIRTLPQPVIAQVHGLATAAGCQLAATCDLIVAAEDARFATPGVNIGLFCTTPAVALCRAVPAKKALEMLFTGEPIDARAAEHAGMVNRVVPVEKLGEETLRLAGQIARSSREVLALGKRAFHEQLPLDRPMAYRLAEGVMVDNCGLDDAREGMSAFLEKRPPQWKVPART